MLRMYDTLLCEKCLNRIADKYSSDRLYNKTNADKTLQLTMYKLLYDSSDEQSEYIIQFLKENYPDMYNKCQTVIWDYLYYYSTGNHVLAEQNKIKNEEEQEEPQFSFTFTDFCSVPEKPQNVWDKILGYIKGLKKNVIK